MRKSVRSEKTVERLINIYEIFIGNLEHNIPNASGDRKVRAEANLEIFKEVIADLKELNEREYEIDFDKNLLALIKVKGGCIEIIGAMNGYGHGIKSDKIIIQNISDRSIDPLKITEQ